MPNLVDVRYAQTGQSTATDHKGMRKMQARAFESRNAPYLLLKAPREWFIVPLHVVETAVQLLIDGEIVNYRYDNKPQENKRCFR